MNEQGGFTQRRKDAKDAKKSKDLAFADFRFEPDTEALRA